MRLFLRRIFLRLTQWWKHLRRPPVVVISRSGQKTDSPKVHVSVASINGSQSVYTWEANDVGEASALMHGRGLANIIRRKLVDRRLVEK